MASMTIVNLPSTKKDDEPGNDIKNVKYNVTGNHVMYDLSGSKVSVPTPGICIVRHTDGTVTKIIKK